MFSRKVSGMIRNQMKDEKINKIKSFEKNTSAASGVKWENSHLTSSAVLEASVVSTRVGSSWGSINEGLVEAESNAWDNSSAPRVDWDAMVDNCKKGN